MNSKTDLIFDPLNGPHGSFVRALIPNIANQESIALIDFAAALKDSNGSGVLFYENPVFLMAKHIADDGDSVAGSALELWKKEAEENLKILRRHRGQVKIIESAKQFDAQSAAILESAFGGEVSKFERADALQSIDTLSMSLAELSIQEDFAAGQILSELRAGSAFATQQLPAAKKTIENLVREIKSLRQSAARNETDTTNKGVEELLSRQILSLQTSLKTVEQERRRLEERTRAAEESSAEAQNALQQVLSSTSWKASSPIRMVKKLYSR